MFPASISMGLIDAILGYGLGLHVRGLMWEYLHRLFSISTFRSSKTLKASPSFGFYVSVGTRQRWLPYLFRCCSTTE